MPHIVRFWFMFTFREHSIIMNITNARGSQIAILEPRYKKATPSGVAFYFKHKPNQYPSFCTKFGLMFNSVAGMGKMRRVGSLLVLKVQEYSHLPKRIRSFLLQPSRATPVCVSTDCLPERR